MITVNFYKSKSRKVRSEVYRFRIIAKNGEQLAKSSEGYANLQDCERAARLITDSEQVRFTYTGIAAR